MLRLAPSALCLGLCAAMLTPLAVHAQSTAAPEVPAAPARHSADHLLAGTAASITSAQAEVTNDQGQDPARNSSADQNPGQDTEAAPSRAGSSWWGSLKDNVAATWHSDRYELYIPLHTWHNRHFYSAEQISKYQENPWGIGIGKYRDTPVGTTHGIGAMVFMDSHNAPEPFIAYTWQKNWQVTEHQQVSLGGFAGFTARKEIAHYAPIPVAWPYVAYRYRNFSVQGMYFPGRSGNGNIAFFWAKYRF